MPLSRNRFYPFGLTMSGISSKAMSFGGAENKYKFNGGVELDRDFGMDLYKCFFRQYDPQIGRFTGIDILSELEYSATVYQFAGNNPIAFNDPLGDRTKYMDQNGTLWSLPGLFRTAFDTHKNQFIDDGEGGGGGGGGWGGGMKITAAMVATYYQRYWAGTERWNIGASDSPNGNGFNVGFSTDPIQTMDNIVIAYSSYAKMERLLFGGGNNWLQNAQRGLDAFGIAHDAKEELINYAAKLSPAIKEMKYVKAVKVGGVVLNVAGILITVWDMKRDGVNVENTADLIIGGVAFIPGVGWITAGGYFLIKEIGSHYVLSPEQQTQRADFINSNRDVILRTNQYILCNKF